MHQFADRLEHTLGVPLIHIADATAQEIKRQGLSKVGLLGTKQTMEMDFYHSRLKAFHLETIVPDEAARDFIQQTITHELLLGQFLETSRARFLEIMAQLHTRGAEGIILGCTEIPLLIRQQDTHLPLFNTLVIHSQSVVDFVLREN
jgi:aspartate racemase